MTSTPWTAAGGDHGPLLTSAYCASQPVYTFEVNVSVIDGWIASPSSNNGFILEKGDESTAGYCNIYSSEHTTTGYRPKLSVYYTLP